MGGTSGGEPARIAFTTGVLPGGLIDLQYTITNVSAIAATDIAFTDDLDAVIPGLAAVGLPHGRRLWSRLFGLGNLADHAGERHIGGGHRLYLLGDGATAGFGYTGRLPEHVRRRVAATRLRSLAQWSHPTVQYQDQTQSMGRSCLGGSVLLPTAGPLGGESL